MTSLGVGAQADGLESFPRTLRDPSGPIWECPYGRESNYYLRRPRTGTMPREFMNSEAVDWGAVRSGTTESIGQSDFGWPNIYYDCLQRWHFSEDFETYGMVLPLVSFDWEGEVEVDPDPFPLRIKLALFQNFPYIHEYQTWKVLPGATFKLDTLLGVPATQVRKLFIPFENRTQGTLVIPAGMYYLFILPDATEFAYQLDVYTRTVRDYSDDTAQVWRSDRYRSFDPDDWDTYDYEDVVFMNDGTAPPVDTSTDPPSQAQPWFKIDFSFLGRFV